MGNRMTRGECLICKKVILGVHPGRIKAGGGKYCSHKCHNIFRRRSMIKKKCLVCEAEFTTAPSSLKRGRGKFCSKECFSISIKGENNYIWNGGKTKHKGYILVAQSGHLYKNNRGYVREHRLVMEKHLGRYLQPEEVVHHINKNKTDNRIENLKLFPTNKEHMEFHYAQR